MDFTQERTAFLAGYGQFDALLVALRAATLYVPLDVDDQFFTLQLPGRPERLRRREPRGFGQAAGGRGGQQGVHE